MRILSFNWHTPYLSMLARLDHQFEIAPPNIDSDMVKVWDEAMRPVPANVTTIDRQAMRVSIAKPGYYDLILAHNVKDIMMARGIVTPKILVFHNKLSTEAKLGGEGNIIDAYRERVREMVSRVYCVFISESKKKDWGLDGVIITPGVDTSLYWGYTGEIRRVLRVGNSVKPRDLMTGYSFGEEVLKNLPNILVGENPDIPESRVSGGWDGLKRAYRENRLFLNTTMPPWEDGYNLGLLEAMATGTPVVSTANPTSPITDGVDGFVAEDAAGLREKVVKLLDDHGLAVKIGAAGKAMVERKFPMSGFVDKWERAINEAKERMAPRTVHSRTLGKMRTGRKNVVVSYTSYPATTGAYIERAFRNKHNTLSFGGKITQYVIDTWNLGTMKDEAKTHDIHCDGFTADIDQLIGEMPKNFEPDFFIWIETGLGGPPVGLEKLGVPTVAYLIDTHIHTDRHMEIASMFDITFLAQRSYIPGFNAAGLERVYWLPLACDPDIHGKKAGFEKEHDVGFVGSLTDSRRVDLLLKLAEKMDVRYDRLFMRDMADFFCKSRIVFNNAIRNDLNMRVFEALCSGSLLMTDHADGLDEFFRDKESLVIYDDGDIAELARYYLDHPDQREAIAENGRKLVLENHTYEHRVDTIIQNLEDLAQ